VGWVSGESSVGATVFVFLCVFGYISVVLEESACVRDCRGLGLCKVGIVGVQWVMSVKDGGVVW
jgi:hypothetical protein